MSPTEVAAFLRNYNVWRRGNLDDQPMPDPREIGEAIDAAIEVIESAEEDRALCDQLADILTRTANVLKGEPKPMRRHGWHDLPDVAQKLQRENAELRAKVDAMERQGPVAWARKLAICLPSFGCVTDLKYRPSNMPESAYMPLYALPGAKGEEE